MWSEWVGKSNRIEANTSIIEAQAQKQNLKIIRSIYILISFNFNEEEMHSTEFDPIE